MVLFNAQSASPEDGTGRTNIHQTEKKLMEDIESLKGKYTLIIVTHRLSTIEKCDKIYIIDKGSIYTGENYKEVAEKFKNFNDRISSKK